MFTLQPPRHIPTCSYLDGAVSRRIRAAGLANGISATGRSLTLQFLQLPCNFGIIGEVISLAFNC